MKQKAKLMDWPKYLLKQRDYYSVMLINLLKDFGCLKGLHLEKLMDSLMVMHLDFLIYLQKLMDFLMEKHLEKYLVTHLDFQRYSHLLMVKQKDWLMDFQKYLQTHLDFPKD